MNRNSSLSRPSGVDVGYATLNLPSDPSRQSVAVTNIPAASQDPGVASQEIFRLVQRVFLSGSVPTPTQVVFCGVDEENDSSMVCARVGETLAALSSRPVCLIDANARTPHLARYFKVEDAAELPTSPLAPCANCASIGPNLWLADVDTLLLKGRVLLAAAQLKQRLEQLRDVFEYVLIDAPGAGMREDAMVLGKVADAAIVVIEAEATRRMAAHKAVDALHSAGVQLLGVVLSNRSFPIPQSLYRRL
jgi:Mrp family chromosome partitioning ATPase